MGIGGADFHPLLACLGWTLIHFVWQGATIGLFFAAVMKVVSRSAAASRHLVALSFLILTGLVPLVTFSVLVLSGPGTGQAEGVSPAWWPAVQHGLDWLLPWAVAGWMLGVVVLSGRLTLDWLAVRRLVRHGTRPLSREMELLAARVMDAYAVRVPVRVLESALVGVPVAVGWLRPIILVPPAALMGLTPYQLELILAHEFAHIRRYDHLVNWYQVIIETLLFYHPVVRWISNRVRQERENCCDDLVVENCGNSVAYARALTELEGLRCQSPSLVLAATDGQLLRRIRRLVARRDPQRGAMAWMLTLLLVLANILVLGGTRVALHGQDEAGHSTAAEHSLPESPRRESGPQAATHDRPTLSGQSADMVAPREEVAASDAALLPVTSPGKASRKVGQPADLVIASEDHAAIPGDAALAAFPEQPPAEAVSPDAAVRQAPRFEPLRLAKLTFAAPELPPPLTDLELPQPEGAATAAEDMQNTAPSAEELLQEVWTTWPETPPPFVEPAKIYTGGELIKGGPPRFPRAAKMLPDGGWVVARFTVTRRGNVKDLTIAESRPQGVFDRAVTKAVAKWRFRPYELEGVAVDREITQAFEFEPDPRLQAKGSGQRPCKIVTGSRLCRSRFAEPWERGVEVIYQARR